jgi:hypothetical protein
MFQEVHSFDFRKHICDSQSPRCRVKQKLSWQHILPIDALRDCQPSQHNMARTNQAQSYHKNAWKEDILLLTCILRLRVQPAVPYSNIADLFLKSLSNRLSALAEKNNNPSNTAANTILTKTISANCSSVPGTLAESTSTNCISATSTLARNGPAFEESNESWMKDWLVQHLENDFRGAEFRADQSWWKARDMDAEVVGEMLRAAELDGRGHVVAAKGETKLQIRWRRVGDWRAGSVPEGPETIVQRDAGIIGDRRS